MIRRCFRVQNCNNAFLGPTGLPTGNHVVFGEFLFRSAVCATQVPPAPVKLDHDRLLLLLDPERSVERYGFRTMFIYLFFIIYGTFLYRKSDTTLKLEKRF